MQKPQSADNCATTPDKNKRNNKNNNNNNNNHNNKNNNRVNPLQNRVGICSGLAEENFKHYLLDFRSDAAALCQPA